MQRDISIRIVRVAQRIITREDLPMVALFSSYSLLYVILSLHSGGKGSTLSCIPTGRAIKPATGEYIIRKISTHESTPAKYRL